MENESTLVIMIDGKIVFRKPIGGPADQALADRKGADGRAQIMERFQKIPVQVQAGVRDVVVAFIDRSHVESDENVASPARFQRPDRQHRAWPRRMPRLVNGVEIVGPYNPKGISRTPSRALIFVCDPKASRGALLRPTDHRKPGAPGFSTSGDARRCEPPHAVL